MSAELAMLNRGLGREIATEVAPMNRHFAHPQWGQELSEKLVWMHKQAVPAAELNLNPRHLGPISIRVDVNQDQTSIVFTTQHAVVKDAIEAAIPKLREMLGAQQLNLVNVDVSQQQSEQKQSNGFWQTSADQRGGDGHERGQESEASPEPVSAVADEIEAGRAVASKGILSIFA
nr:flagellar hook-length control protein FliK [Methylomarinum sp. Ch1-1]MDP4519628.1 flagellar hook-length control protein FliK [Methylomarinum sp. Ch1-1]